MTKLTEKQLIKLMAESYQLKILSTLKEAGLKIDMARDIDKDGEQEQLISVGLKVKHKDSGLLYTLDTVGTNGVTLKTPEGKLFDVFSDEFEKEYVLS